ncbi:hypothetical protein BG36_13450 [Aquamicrobium defluvii]|uniref:Uncharacterized protein n=1 Tax=Aquamicrobium defluvii TaxID=69279 RepID=A0A011V3I9_9HYPH|nr:hypothetical protein BG36_13450 [Aquamicrobium defluvii]EZQ13449.1 hypothetical protein CF98_27870 [Halopseudomonas bauzanensis]
MKCSSETGDSHVIDIIDEELATEPSVITHQRGGTDMDMRVHVLSRFPRWKENRNISGFLRIAGASVSPALTQFRTQTAPDLCGKLLRPEPGWLPAIAPALLPASIARAHGGHAGNVSAEPARLRNV